ncbi:MAG TPA: hypothetical protein ENI96_01465 [Sedimenticola thiotaurini]|uniref:Uncharacterized protein n=1 Tax=Sedimenticola thiotaurini TaxID=1543721 RepID=A0A831RH06_9GAMM|nr:hypothetical protein [Sedimenticola thiotaurini]
MPQSTESITRQVQHNCHVADARHAKEYGLCTYLMKMREYYRWEQGLGFDAPLAMDEVGEWLTRREQLWSGLGASAFQSLEIDGHHYDPFDVAAINDRLLPRRLVYSGGLGSAGRPHFFLAELERLERAEGQVRVVSGRELARDLASPAAMMCEPYLFVRRESLRRLLWEKLESWRWRRPDNALGRAFACYDFDRRLAASLERMTDAEMELVLLHERGEHEAGRRLGAGWNDMLVALAGTAAELMARAVRDHLADCIETLPALARMESPPSIHFYVGNLAGMRRELFPALQQGYDRWLEDADPSFLESLAREGRAHWRRVGEEMLMLFRERGAEAGGVIGRRLAEWRFGAPR